MYIEELAKSEKTVFSVKDLRLLWGIRDSLYLKTVINRLFLRGSIVRVSRGLYARNRSYDIFEVANKLKIPSYVSLETVLAKENIIFQRYGNAVYSVSNNTLFRKVGEYDFRYRKIQDSILSNPIGIEQQGSAMVATKERAMADRLYLTPGYHFDTVRQVNKELLAKIARIYNERTRKEILNSIQD